MKTIHFLIGTALTAGVLSGCNSKEHKDADTDTVLTEEAVTGSDEPQITAGSYTDLNTGKQVYIVKDPETGYAMDSIARIPVELYIDNSGDTIYKTGVVVNNAVVRSDAGTWILDESKVKVDGDKIKIKDGDTKIKIDGDKMKVKEGDYKLKTDGDKSKEKDGDYKKKVDGEDSKVKTDEVKIKTEDGKTKVKPKD
ncbi:hypothetical protein [Hufsiella ginkgonis]|uniref:Lipoprotein n=1 Tax=Hufsiella ginkgonis TaxID=2695274 RepID=A0A7K1XYP7_9SPHI|nr:hypothetical protein [Hufsiella ginkgonis]MXV16124.1 hypothetical protein [Hufsiella ginkgonis]